MANIFGYGSLINRGSVGKTLGLDVKDIQMSAVTLKGYHRVWDLVEYISFDGKKFQEAIFLNIYPEKEATCWGVIVKVPDADFIELDKRERHYDRIDVSHLIEPAADETVYTYIGKDEYISPSDHAVVCERYENMVKEAFLDWGEDIYKTKYLSEPNHSFPVVSGVYTFKP